MGLVGQITSLLMGSYLPSTGQIKRSAVAFVLIAILLATAYVALIVAAWFVIDDIYGPEVASLLIAAGTIVLAGVVWLVTVALNRRARRRAIIARRVQAAAVEQSLAQAAVLATPALLNKHPISTLVAIAGVSFGLMKIAQRPKREE